MRIASLLPSATEIVCALGLREHLVGVSHECDWPEDVQGLPVLTAPKVDPTGTSIEIDRQVRALASAGLSVYRIDEERLRELRPDVIVTQDTCQVCAVSLDEVREAARRLAGPNVELVSLSPLTLDGVLESFVEVGGATGALARAREVVGALRLRLDALGDATAKLPRRRVLFLEWLDPPMIGGHWTPELLRIAGADPVLGHEGMATSSTSWEAIAAANPELVLIAPCGFRIAQTMAELPALLQEPAVASLRAVEQGQVVVVDGNAYFNRPGPRLVESAAIASVAIHGEELQTATVPADAMTRWSKP